tara:strand:- start:186 stop:500 length:315 start_codon:yes stop_codon:yes gene_type:complete
MKKTKWYSKLNKKEVAEQNVYLQGQIKKLKEEVLYHKGTFESVKEDLINQQHKNKTLRLEIKDLEFRNLEEKVFLLEKIIRLHEDTPKNITSYSNGVSTITTGG